MMDSTEATKVDDDSANVNENPFDKKNKDEPISETEFKLLFVDLTKDSPMNNFIDLTHSTSNHPVMDYSYTNLNRPFRSMNVSKATAHRGRGRPKGSASKSSVHKKGKKQSKQQHVPKHSDFILPERLKKRAKAESDIIIDLTKRSVAPVIETGFDLKDKIDVKTWKLLDKKAIVCTLCSKPGNFAVLGPLFGPYKIFVDKASNDVKEVRGQKAEKMLNVRLHRDCAVWTPGLCFVGSDLVGMGRALTDAAKKVCL